MKRESDSGIRQCMTFMKMSAIERRRRMVGIEDLMGRRPKTPTGEPG
jgi:hypothetical protein